MSKAQFLARLVSFYFVVLSLFAQQPAPQQPSPARAIDEKPEDDGIPITSTVVRTACAPCHTTDDKNRMSRISYRRTTPEGWQETIRRMVSLNKVELTPKDAREIVRYLSNHLGLAPEEARPALFEVERRMIDFKYTDRDIEQICARCHSLGRVISQRRTKEEWELLIAMHRGYYPLSDFQAFRRTGPPQTQPGPDGRPPDNRHPMEKAVAHLAEAFPLKTNEWSAWSANMRTPKLAGRWALSGYQVGRGALYGQMVITTNPEAEDEFVTQVRYAYARSGSSVERAGKALVYTGFQWRGRSFDGKDEKSGLREVMFVERDWQRMSGRWFTGAYDELGTDIRLQRITNDPIVLGVEPIALKTSSSARTVRIFGANFAAKLTPADVNFGQGVRVTRIVSADPDSVSVEVEVAADAPVGARDVFVSGAARHAAVVVFNKTDGIKVRPQAGMARVGGANFPKQYQQFEAVAYNNGADGKPDTKDDLDLGIVDVAWSLEEYTATFGDDDKEFVGTIDASGLFTPNIDGPNPKRKNQTNNYGDVWVVATFSPEAGGPPARPIRARAHLLVTVPVYMRWEPSEVTR